MDFLGNGDKSSTSFIEKSSQMLHSLTCGSTNKGDYLLFQMSTINAAISFITHFPTHPFECSLLKGDVCCLPRPGQINGIFFEAKIPAWWQHQEKLSVQNTTLGNNTANQHEKRRRGKKIQQSQVPPLWRFYGLSVLRTSTLVHPPRQSYL